MVMNRGCPTIAPLLTVLAPSGGRRPSYGEHFSRGLKFDHFFALDSNGDNSAFETTALKLHAVTITASLQENYKRCAMHGES